MTIHTAPLSPSRATSYPDLVRILIVARSEMFAGAAVLASAISASRGMRYSSIDGYLVSPRIAPEPKPVRRTASPNVMRFISITAPFSSCLVLVLRAAADSGYATFSCRPPHLSCGRVGGSSGFQRMALCEVVVRDRQQAKEDQRIDDEQNAEVACVAAAEMGNRGRHQRDCEAGVRELLHLERNGWDRLHRRASLLPNQDGRVVRHPYVLDLDPRAECFFSTKSPR